jgi:hypothetical protein
VSVQVGWWHKRGRVKPRRVERMPKRWLP